MTMKKWNGTGHGCDTCNALNEQVHSAETWANAGLFPKCTKLVCEENCKCKLEDTEESERGSLSEVPYRDTFATPGYLRVLASQPGGTYEVAIITAGQAIGHPWFFTSSVLERAAAMFNNIPSYIDHEATPDKARHSARDLGGRLTSPRFDPTLGGIIASLQPTGPSAQDMRDLAQAALDDPSLDIGFSADIDLVSQNGKNVDEITRVRSADVVLSPARGGRFLRARLSRLTGVTSMDTTTSTTPSGSLTATDGAPANEQVVEQMRALLNVQAEQDAARKQREEMTKLQVAQCAYLLESGISASGLPTPAAERIRAQFQGKAFTADELTQAIKDKREEISALMAESTVKGVGRVSAMFSQRDQLQAAVYDMFMVKRDPEQTTLKVHRLSGIRELYTGLTGDYEISGSIDPTRAMFQGTTATFPALVKNALNKAIAEAWQMYGEAGYDWWQKIATIEPFETLNSITWIRMGTIASLPSVAEGAEYTELSLGDNAETSSFTKYGGFLGITLEALDRDDLRKLRAAPREIALAAIRNISEQVAAIFTSNSGAGPTMADTGALFNATAVTSQGGHANLLTTALGTDYTAWKAAAAAMYKQPLLLAQTTYGGGKRQAIEPRFCLVPRDLKDQAEALFIPRWEATQQNVAAVSPTWGGKVEPITVPEWTDATDWAAVADPRLLPGVMIGTRYGITPQVVLAGSENDPAMFTNDESRLKVRHFLAVGVADWRALHKSNVA